MRLYQILKNAHKNSNMYKSAYYLYKEKKVPLLAEIEDVYVKTVNYSYCTFKVFELIPKNLKYSLKTDTYIVWTFYNPK